MDAQHAPLRVTLSAGTPGDPPTSPGGGGPGPRRKVTGEKEPSEGEVRSKTDSGEQVPVHQDLG